MTDFDPDGPAGGDGVFGLPHGEADAALVLLPVPWEATTSYGGGTSRGPAAILAASAQIDLFDPQVGDPWRPGIHMLAESPRVRAWNNKAKAAAQKVIRAGGEANTPALRKALAEANQLGGELNGWVRSECARLMAAGKVVGVVGGDHSVPYGAFQAAAERHGSFGLLHFDAHSDTREAYEGFLWSHASIMRNALRDIPQISKIVQVGIRDFCREEDDYVRGLGPRARMFTARELSSRRFAGKPFGEAAAEAVAALPEKVWVTFDIDGLDPKLCPGTGTPVPGGLEFDEADHILGLLARSGRTILGFDLVEVSPSPGGKDEWDANVGMRLLYRLAAWTLRSRGLVKDR
ncbi:MAG: arginase family protein [Elusimicrobia bacterium]|nr:arginase family protein [Elusimicrobiota bacterium]